MKNVAFFLTGLDSGGLENYLLRFLNIHHSEFNNVFVYCKGGKGGQLENQYRMLDNVQVIKHKVGYINILDYWKIKSFLSETNIDVICDFTGNFAGCIMYCGALAGIKNRIAFYRSSSDRFGSNFFKNIYNNFVNSLTYRFSTSILSNSYAAFKHFFAGDHFDSRFEVIYNGIDSNNYSIGSKNLREELNIPSEGFVVGHTGRYNPAKNHAVIVQVIKKLLEEEDNIYFILCGNNVRSNLAELFLNDEFADKVKIFDYRDDVPLFLNTMDLFFFPSITEGQPNSLIEAMIMGIPFVASDIESIKETVGETYFDCLSDPLDVPKFVNLIKEKKRLELVVIQF